ncbi:hypothetical protein AAF712_012914 [Marasmius tenuissimus]|uniref:WD40 repeat-like protein n=1 Tax=Marasmius tenuissimus TaxID=585030 RepID=A0ABR2ZF78_9AGAR
MTAPPSEQSYPPSFEIWKTLQGAQNAILSVKFSPDGKFLCAAGYNGVSVWELESGASVDLPRRGSSPTKTKYIYTTSGWIYYEDHHHHVLSLGSLEGDVIAWDWNKKKSAFESTRTGLPVVASNQVTSIDILQPSFSHKGRAAISHYDHTVSVWKIPSEGDFIKVFSVDLGFIPRTVAFDSITKHVYAFALNGGNISLLHSTSGKVVRFTDKRPSTVGYVSLHRQTDRLIASTGKNFQILQLRNYLPLSTLESDPPIVLFPMQAAFIGDGTHVIVGSDKGASIIYDTRTGKAFQALEYPKGGLVQTVTVGVLNNAVYVAVAGSTLQQPADVMIWRMKPATSGSSRRPRRGLGLGMKRVLGALAMCAVALSGFKFSQSLSDKYYLDSRMEGWLKPMEDAQMEAAKLDDYHYSVMDQLFKRYKTMNEGDRPGSHELSFGSEGLGTSGPNGGHTRSAVSP